MENSQLKAGDVVKLKSGSPEMTIYWVNSENTARCIWYSEKEDKIKFDDLTLECLIRVNQE